MRATRHFAAVLVAAAATLLLATPAWAAPSAQDTTWMVAAHQSNLAEIAAGNAAQKQATSQSVKDLGAMFVQMHTTLDASLTAAAGTLGVSLPAAPTAAQQKSLAAVTAHTGAAFDSAWVAQQIAGHREAQTGTQTEIASGSDQSVVALAKTALPVIQRHLASLNALSGTPSSVQAGSGGQAATSGSPFLVTLLVCCALALLVAAGGWRYARR